MNNALALALLLCLCAGCLGHIWALHARLRRRDTQLIACRALLDQYDAPLVAVQDADDLTLERVVYLRRGVSVSLETRRRLENELELSVGEVHPGAIRRCASEEELVAVCKELREVE